MRLKKCLLLLFFPFIFWISYKNFLGILWIPNNDQILHLFVKNESDDGLIDVHTWLLDCKYSLENLRKYPLFPFASNYRSTMAPFQTHGKRNINSRFLADRSMGYLNVPATGLYFFHIKVNGDAELSIGQTWKTHQLIWSSRKNTTRLVAKTNILKKLPNDNIIENEISTPVFLNKGQLYIFEFLHIYKTNEAFNVSIKWKSPNNRTWKFHEIDNSLFQPLSTKNSEAITSSQDMQAKKKTKMMYSIRKNTHQLRNIQANVIPLVLNICNYQRGYVQRAVINTYDAVSKFLNPTYVYPEVTHENLKDMKFIPWFPLDETQAKIITNKYMKYVNQIYPGKYEVVEILNVERKGNVVGKILDYKGEIKDGERYLLELKLRDKNENKEVFTSQYIYEDFKKQFLCYPENFQWKTSTPIYFLVSLKRQSAWFLHLIRNMERIYLNTNDTNLHLIIYDYHTKDIDLEKELAKNMFKNYQILRGRGDEKYSRTYSLNKAAAVVTNPHAILFTIDLHLQIPDTLPNSIRKHCIEGQSVYTPIISRLDCGAMPDAPRGSWDPWGYGMFGAYKSDWDRFHGFDVVKYKTKWGGEDWDLVDRAYKVGLEFERIKHADFYHYHHSRKGMWEHDNHVTVTS